MPSHHHHLHRHSAVSIGWLLTQSPRPNGWLFDWLIDCVKSHAHAQCVCENSQRRMKCSVKFTLPYTRCAGVSECALCARCAFIFTHTHTSVCWMCSSIQLDYNKSVFIAMLIQWCRHRDERWDDGCTMLH